MDPLQSKEIIDDANQCPLIVVSSGGEVRIQLEGSHTTSTATDSGLATTHKKFVKFENNTTKEDEKQNLRENSSSTLKENKEDKKKLEHQVEYSDKEDNLSDVKLMQVVSPERKEIIENERIKENAALVCSKQKESKNNSPRFNKILDMFDSFTKNPASQEIGDKSSTFTEIAVGGCKRKRPQRKLEEEIQVHRSRCEEYFVGNLSKEDAHSFKPVIKSKRLRRSISANTSSEFLVERQGEKYLEQQEISVQELKTEQKKAAGSCTISTTTSSCEVKSLGCQTQISDCFSVHELSLLEGSSLTSRCEPTNSLNNYAQADNACIPIYHSQPVTTKRTVTGPLVQQPFASAAMVAEPNEPAFNIITIEANSRPSSIDLRRPPFCQRLWELVGDFCAATFLCLQVNRDCIFCLGFFAAFVVSASFLTAFFYHTLVISPSLWLTEQNV